MKIKSAVAVGYSIIVEMLSEQEAAGTELILANKDSHQAYVTAIGPLTAKDAGIAVGNRVLLQGTYVPLPVKSKAGRKMGVVDLHNIKAVLVEAD